MDVHTLAGEQMEGKLAARGVRAAESMESPVATEALTRTCEGHTFLLRGLSAP